MKNNVYNLPITQVHQTNKTVRPCKGIFKYYFRKIREKRLVWNYFTFLFWFPRQRWPYLCNWYTCWAPFIPLGLNIILWSFILSLMLIKLVYTYPRFFFIDVPVPIQVSERISTCDARGNDFVSMLMIYVRFWSCSDGVVYFIFYFVKYI